MLSQYHMLDQLIDQLKPSADMVAKYRALRQGVDYTQNRIEYGGFGDGSIDEQTWTAARDLADAFEALESAWARLDLERIPF